MTTAQPSPCAMADLNQDIRENFLSLMDHAQRRLDTLREVVGSANGECAGSEIRIAIGDAITPLNLALEVAEGLE